MTGVVREERERAVQALAEIHESHRRVKAASVGYGPGGYGFVECACGWIAKSKLCCPNDEYDAHTDAVRIDALADAGLLGGVELRTALESLRVEHRYVEDCWYSCPKATDGCCDDSQGDECNCGADAHNAIIDAALSASTGPEQ